MRERRANRTWKRFLVKFSRTSFRLSCRRYNSHERNAITSRHVLSLVYEQLRSWRNDESSVKRRSKNTEANGWTLITARSCLVFSGYYRLTGVNSSVRLVECERFTRVTAVQIKRHRAKSRAITLGTTCRAINATIKVTWPWSALNPRCHTMNDCRAGATTDRARLWAVLECRRSVANGLCLWSRVV